MRVLESRRGYFHGTHKGATITIEREPYTAPGHFYIMVTASDGGRLYDGWSPQGVHTMPEAKRAALHGAGLTPHTTKGVG